MGLLEIGFQVKSRNLVMNSNVGNVYKYTIPRIVIKTSKKQPMRCGKAHTT